MRPRPPAPPGGGQRAAAATRAQPARPLPQTVVKRTKIGGLWVAASSDAVVLRDLDPA